MDFNCPCLNYLLYLPITQQKKHPEGWFDQINYLRPLQNSPKSPECLGGNLGDFGEFCKGLKLIIRSGFPPARE